MTTIDNASNRKLHLFQTKRQPYNKFSQEKVHLYVLSGMEGSICVKKSTNFFYHKRFLENDTNIKKEIYILDPLDPLVHLYLIHCIIKNLFVVWFFFLLFRFQINLAFQITLNSPFKVVNQVLGIMRNFGVNIYLCPLSLDIRNLLLD